MDRERLFQLPDEYRHLFQFFFVFRVIALAFGLIWLLFKISQGANYTFGLFIWLGILLYTIAIYIKRHEMYALLLKHPTSLGFDIFVSVALLFAYSAGDSPFYYYSISPVIPAAMMFRFKGAVYSSGILSLSQLASVFVHGATMNEFFSLGHFPLFLGQITAYFTVGFMLVYPAGLLDGVIRQRSIIKEKTEKEAVSEERARLARELHDNLAQLLSVTKSKTNTLYEELSGKMADQAFDACQLIDHALQDLKNAIFALRPENIELGLDQMLTDFCRRLPFPNGCKIDTYFNIDGVNLSGEQKFEILRICQEALGNSVRHSRSDTIKLEAIKENRKLLVYIEDRGTGFEAAKISKGVGLLSMRERAEKLKADIEIISALEAGTKVKLTVPLKG